MALLDIVKYGDPRLRGKSAPITPREIDDALRTLITDMAETMYASKGIGLAAPQIGRSIRLLIVDSEQVSPENSWSVERRRLHVFINPDIVEESVKDGPHTEGCLSIPDIEGEVHRPLEITVHALDINGQPFEIEADGLLARVIQHENDHLEGILFPDRMAPAKRALIAGKLNALRRETESALAGTK